LSDKNTPDDLDTILNELAEIISGIKETAAGKDTTDGSFHSHRPDLVKLSSFMGTAKEIIELINQKTSNYKEASFIASFVKGAIDYWGPKKK